jgi:hypothetical protein
MVMMVVMKNVAKNVEPKDRRLIQYETDVSIL